MVATPLGNLDDLTVRARDTLARADRILAEDTRVTATLLSHCGIAARPSALHAHNEAKRVHDVVAALGRGERVALVTDAGTPAISDPGAHQARARIADRRCPRIGHQGNALGRGERLSLIHI